MTSVIIVLAIHKYCTATAYRKASYLADCHPTEGFLSTWRKVTYLSSVLLSLGRLPAAVWAVSFL